MKNYLIVSLVIFFLISCASEESKNDKITNNLENNQSIDFNKLEDNNSFNTRSSSIIGTWIVDVDRTINHMQNSPSFNASEDGWKKFMLKISNETLPHVKYTFLNDGVVNNNSPIIRRDNYKKTIWKEENSQVIMIVILDESELTYNMKFKSYNDVEMISNHNDEIFYLIRI